VAQKQVRLKEENKCHNFEWWDKYVMMRLTGRHYPWHIDNKKYSQVNCGNHKAKTCALCPGDKGRGWCHGDCAWCDATDKCIEYDDAQKPECKKKPTTKPPEVKKVQRALVPAGFENKMTISVVLPCGFEHDFFKRTAQSVFDETPEGVLKEIVIVDDASDPPLKQSWSEADAAKYNVKYVRLDSPAGLIGAKQAGAEAATGDIIVFFDCHVKPGKDYWLLYVKQINENYKRVVIPVITNLNVDTWEEYNRPTSGGGMSKCYLTFDAEFKWTTDDTPNVPIMSGGLLAISRKWFFEIGGYDSSMLGWGGENLDQSLRIWTCGGEIVSAADSFVAHMWRDGTPKTKAKYKLGAGDASKNQARAVKAHIGPWFDKTLTFPKYTQFKGKDLDTSAITDVTKKLGCNNFEWYLDKFKYIYRDAGVLPKEVFQIESSATTDKPQCLKLKKASWTNYGTPDELELTDCLDGHSNPNPQYWHLSNRREDKTCCGGLRAWNTDQCIDGRNPQATEDKVATYGCDLASGLETSLKPKEGKTDEYLVALGKGSQHGKLCLSVKDSKPIIVGCDNATTWKKRNPFTPIEYELLSEDARKNW
jgi:polypeptide N-acetylgalactosaminyltransferase